MATYAPNRNSQSDGSNVLAQTTKLVSDGKYFAAAVLLQDELSKDPENPDLLYPLATCQRNLDKPETALETLQCLDKHRPNFPGTWLERGRVLKSTGNIKAAISCFETCVRLNPAYIGGWTGLVELREHIQRLNLRDEAVDQYRFMTSLDRALILILRAFYDGQTYKAERLCRAYLKTKPQSVEAMRILARIGVRYGILDDAEFILESACEFDPEHRQARLEYIDILHKRQQYAKALQNAQILLQQNPSDLLHKLACANQQMAMGQFEPAIETYDEILEQNPHSSLANAQLHLTRGHAYKTNGDIEKSIEDYRFAYQKRADFGDAYWSLANLKTYCFTIAELDRMRKLVESSAISDEDRVHVLFALGKSFEDSKQFEESFGYYERGNDLNRNRLRYDSADMTERLQLQRQVCTSDFLHARKNDGCSAPDPIFVVGLPRAGSTLLEQILASHSQVEGTLELHHIGVYAQRLDGRRRTNEPPRYPRVLKDLTPTLTRQLGERYLQETRVHRTDKPYFIDKMPNNFRHIGLISMILPNAKIIDARRHPMGCCFSGYKQLFASGQEFTYGQKEIGTYYGDYRRLMDHWDQVLPGTVLRVCYEEVVDNLEHEVRRILEYCRLPFEESCLRFHDTKRSVRTPSAEQVRQPIYREGLDQWRNYSKWLGPMQSALGDCLTQYPHS